MRNSQVDTHANVSSTMGQQPPTQELHGLRRQRQMIEQGRGMGSGREYSPFLQIERAGFQSRGRSHLVFNDNLDRQHHLLSDLELLNFIWAWSLKPIDLREQFPLQVYEFDLQFALREQPAKGSLEIAKTLGFRHPWFTKTDFKVMTTDLLVSFADGSHLAIHAKYMKDLLNSTKRALELRKIEKNYWRYRGVRFVIADEQPFTTQLADQMMWAIDGMKWDGEPACLEAILIILDTTLTHYPLGEKLSQCSARLGMSSEAVTRAFKYAILTRQWRPHQLEQELDLSYVWPGRRVRGQSVATARKYRRPHR
jgi:hypothetical protein